jgi:CDP-glucose 4,6-dehydratase
MTVEHRKPWNLEQMLAISRPHSRRRKGQSLEAMSRIDKSFWKQRRVLLTGHSGFKGAWLAAWLRQMGATVHGISLPPVTNPSLHAIMTDADLPADEHVDIREAAKLQACLLAVQPEIVLHLAAQPLVRASYQRPELTFSTNVMGTVNILDAIRLTPSVRVGVIVTTDKVYENRETGQPFVESDRLGGHDPYSNSKACAELATQCYRDSFFKGPSAPAIAAARAGNVIGGGDWSADRLVPDVVRAMTARQPVELRYPQSVRPWQHVLDPLHGYLVLAQQLWRQPEKAPGAVNFGPAATGFVTVAGMLERLNAALGGKGWQQAPGQHPAEAGLLTLAIDLAKDALGWKPVLDVDQTIAWTALWYQAWYQGDDMRAMTLKQINDFEKAIDLS